MESFIDEPLKLYDTVYRKEFNNNCKEFFDNALKEANIDKEENEKTCAEYYKLENNFKNVNKEIKRLKNLRTLTIILYFFSVFICIFLSTNFEDLSLLFIGIIILLSVLAIYLVFFNINKKIKSKKEIINSISSFMDEVKRKAYEQVAPLLERFTYDIPKFLIEKTVPEIDLDDYFTLDKYYHLISNYNFAPFFPENESTLSIVSGNIKGFPFAGLTSIRQDMIDKVYVGALTIHWTTVESDGKGNSHTVHHTQVLHAESVHPAPIYKKNTRLYYGNDAAPSLCFTRSSSNIANLSDKEIERKINKFSKKVDKKSQKALGKTNFTSMGNDEFEALFGATNRNNEVEFRLLFTPLAQKNEIALIRDRKYFGDDFTFIKEKKLNTIISTHSQGFDFSGNPSNYYSFDYKKIEENFFNYNEDFFTNLYFDFAPLLNIPLYQQTDSVIRMKKVNYSKCGRNFNPYEAECLANAIEDDFAPINSKTRSILKTNITSSSNGKDIFEVTAHSFDIIDRVDLIPVLGGDGRLHPVPVHWDEFVPIVNTQGFEVSRKNIDNANVIQRGFNARIIN